MISKVCVGIALGSNLGDRQAELDAGISFLQTLCSPSRLRESRRIESLPVDCPPGSQNFLNSVAEIEFDPEAMPPRKLMLRLQAFERARGRPPDRETNAPRPLDLDIIYYGDRAIREPDLIIPHPRAAQRPFVLRPLSDLHPDLILPGQTKTVRELFLAAMPDGFAWKTQKVHATLNPDALGAQDYPRMGS